MAEEQNKTVYQLVTEKVELARGKLDELREKLKDFDAKEQTAAGKDKAAAYLKATMDKTQEALGDLSKQAQSLKDSATDIPVRAFTNAFARVNDSLTDLKERAKKFDEEHQLTSKLSDVIHSPREQAQVAVAAASSYVTEAAHNAFAQLQGVSDGIKFRVMSAADQGVAKGVTMVVTADEKLRIKEKADLVAQKVKEFNEKYHVSDTLVDLDKRWSLTSYFTSLWASAVNLDQRVTGGKVEPAVSSAYELGLQMAGYVKDKYDKATVDASPEVPAAAPPAPEPVKPKEPEPKATPQGGKKGKAQDAKAPVAPAVPAEPATVSAGVQDGA